MGKTERNVLTQKVKKGH